MRNCSPPFPFASLPTIRSPCTNVCCETTAREANMRDYKVFFISDATATFNTPEASIAQIQPVVLATMKAAFAQVENTAT